MRKMRRFDWAALLQAGLQGLRLRPEEFWQLTPAELRLMLGQPGAAAPLGRKRLDDLMARFPDRPATGAKENSQ
jgi:uncharacterized phage protein (TIGR02216 family)